MSRRRHLSTDISVDASFAGLAADGNYLAATLFLLAIPHADDWARLRGEPLAFKLQVCPGFDVTLEEIEQALEAIAAADLWHLYEHEGGKFIAYKQKSWFRVQSYVPSRKRLDDSGSEIPRPPDWPESSTPKAEKNLSKKASPQNAAEHRESPQNTASPSPSPSVSPSPSPPPSVSPSPSPTHSPSTYIRPDHSDLGKAAKPLTPQQRRIKYVRDLFEADGLPRPSTKTAAGFFRHFKREPKEVILILEELAGRGELGQGELYIHGVLLRAAQGETVFCGETQDFLPGGDETRYLQAKALEERSLISANKPYPEPEVSTGPEGSEEEEEDV